MSSHQINHLGLDTNKYITQPLMSLLFVLSTCPIESNESSQSMQVSCLNFDEFLAKNIHSQLINFHKTKTFIFQSYMLRMFFSLNEENLQLPKMVLTEEMNKDYIKFMNLLMSEIYISIFSKKVPQVLPEKRIILQLSIEKRIGDWFLFENRTMIRLYGLCIHLMYFHIS